MKRGLIATGVLALIAVLWRVWPQADPLPIRGLAPGPVLVTQRGESIALQPDAMEIFRRAFWRHPSKEDVIENAERREWSDTADKRLLRWQWFLQVKPSPELFKSLEDESKFSLKLTMRSASWSTLAPPPRWFPRRDSMDQAEVYQSPRGGMTLLYFPKENLLFATDEGHGMTAPVFAK